MDEIHANLQKGGNKICPCAIVHEGHEESFVKRKKLKNIHYFASAELSYEQLWEVIFDYVDKTKQMMLHLFLSFFLLYKSRTRFGIFFILLIKLNKCCCICF